MVRRAAAWVGTFVPVDLVSAIGVWVMGSSRRLLSVVCAGVLVCSLAGLAVVASAGSASALPSNCTGTTTVTCTFAYNGTDGTDGSAQTWTVPVGVTSATFDVEGAEGGGKQRSHFAGGLGGQTTGTLAVIGGSTVTITVGGHGDLGAPGRNGFNGGGEARTALSGGGASDVRVGGSTLADRVLVAGGGGGGAASCSVTCAAGGAGGGDTGGDGRSPQVRPVGRAAPRPRVAPGIRNISWW